MNTLNLKKSKDCPNVILDIENELFKIEGCSFPEKPDEFYIPIIEWFDTWSKNPLNKLTIKFHLSYTNSGTDKMLALIFEKIRHVSNLAQNIKLYWYYDKEDDMIKDLGETLTNDTDMEVNMVEMS